MKIQKVKLSDMHAPEKNVRIHTEQQLKEFVRSVNMFGQIRPIVLDDKMVILAGNGLYKALEIAGHTEADAYIMKDLTENQKKKLMIADNKIFNLGIENLETLNLFLEELGGDLDIPGFDEEILKTMVGDAEEVTEKLLEYGTLDESDINEIIANKDRKEARIEKESQEVSQGPESNQDNSSIDTTEERDRVVCPKCGEVIWL